MLNDTKIDENNREINKRRMNYFIPNFLEKFIRKDDKICSVGCGTGYDVELLNSMGYNGYGIDPGNRTTEWKYRPVEIQKKLKFGFAEDLPFAKGKFDFIYALEVIEHVGCKDGIWELVDNYIEIRVKILNSLLEMLRPCGRLLISTSNRLFPIDLGHALHYNKLTNYASKYGLNLTIPWHHRNFILSFNDIRKYLKMGNFPMKYSVKQISSYRYPSNSSIKYGAVIGFLINNLLWLFSIYPVIRFNPILIVQVIKHE